MERPLLSRRDQGRVGSLGDRRDGIRPAKQRSRRHVRSEPRACPSDGVPSVGHALQARPVRRGGGIEAEPVVDDLEDEPTVLLRQSDLRPARTRVLRDVVQGFEDAEVGGRLLSGGSARSPCRARQLGSTDDAPGLRVPGPSPFPMASLASSCVHARGVGLAPTRCRIPPHRSAPGCRGSGTSQPARSDGWRRAPARTEATRSQGRAPPPSRGSHRSEPGSCRPPSGSRICTRPGYVPVALAPAPLPPSRPRNANRSRLLSP